jgi:site-specific DNA recombinase
MVRDACLRRGTVPSGDCKGNRADQRDVSRVARLAFLAPELVEAILEGRQAFELTLDTLFNPFPANWAEQKALLGS